ncbi:tyrosine phosphatase family-domain-containing protein [Sphaerosporella brunnea]|uniref:diphosphoinositol-polyphosphate diphosphatase n=1 Tax=Sphaerosporella brunnea TaxID=1250544 RepID=A0A5J5EZ04_9PEZI|nr:tyrosine phosphatase family-domain-containing protein [Sphaerosporella brunnea]
MVYRSSFPKPENFPYLKKLGLKTILTLVSEPYPEPNAQFILENGIVHYQIGMPGNKENCITPVPDEKITAALNIILDRRNHPLLIHCNKGKHRTGTVVGCLRRFQAWSLASAQEEYRRFAGSKSRPHDLWKIETYGLQACWDIARENGWVPPTMPVETEDEDVDNPLSIICPAAIKAQ